MAELASNNPTLLDLARALDPNGQIAAVVEILNQTNEILADIPFMEGNLIDGHKVTVRTGIPEPVWFKFYKGTPPVKSTTATVTEATGILTQYAEVDKELADLNGNASAFRLQQERPILEGFGQKFARYLFYGNLTTEPEGILGLTPRFSSLSAENADNIVNGGMLAGQTDGRSIWLVVWDESTCTGIYPKGSRTGISIDDKGVVTSETAGGSGNRLEVYRTFYKQAVGLAVPDWRFIVRICNIDNSLLSPTLSGGADLADLMFQAMERVPNLGRGRPVFYMARDVRTMLRRQLVHKVAQSTLTTQMAGGVMTQFFHEVPMRRCDALATDEARVV